MNEEKQVYELSYLLLPSIAENEVNAVVEKIKSVINKAGGVEIAGEEPFKHELAYEMSKTIGASRYVVNEAYIGWTKFELEPQKALDLNMEINQIQEILRSLLIKAPRETHFTFADAKAKIAEQEAREREAKIALEEGEKAPAAEEVVE